VGEGRGRDEYPPQHCLDSNALMQLEVLLYVGYSANVILVFICVLFSGDDLVTMAECVQCSEDLSKTKSSTASVFYATGSRLFKTNAIYDSKRIDNRVVIYNAEQVLSAENVAADVSGGVLVSDRICPYCSELIACSVSQDEYELHVQSHLDSDYADDEVI